MTKKEIHEKIHLCEFHYEEHHFKLQVHILQKYKYVQLKILRVKWLALIG
jgi:hypothetical protein